MMRQDPTELLDILENAVTHYHDGYDDKPEPPKLMMAYDGNWWTINFGGYEAGSETLHMAAAMLLEVMVKDAVRAFPASEEVYS